MNQTTQTSSHDVFKMNKEHFLKYNYKIHPAIKLFKNECNITPCRDE